MFGAPATGRSEQDHADMVKSLVLATLCAAALLPTAAFADDESAACTTEPQSSWLSPDAIKAKALEAGYTEVRNVKVMGTCYEVYALTAAGERAEFLMNPIDGSVASDGDDD
jgi:hypothetical protein